MNKEVKCETKSEVEMPQLSNWGLFFLRADGKENRLVIAEKFAEFILDRDANKLEIPGICCMRGKLSTARKCKDDGTYQFTGNLVSVERIRRAEYADGRAHDMLCVVDQAGKRYFLYSDERNGYMKLLFQDIMWKGELDESPAFYIPREFRYLNTRWY